VAFCPVAFCPDPSSTSGNPTTPFLLVGHQEKGLFPCDSIILDVFRNVVAPGDARSTDLA